MVQTFAQGRGASRPARGRKPHATPSHFRRKPRRHPGVRRKPRATPSHFRRKPRATPSHFRRKPRATRALFASTIQP